MTCAVAAVFVQVAAAFCRPCALVVLASKEWLERAAAAAVV